MIKKFKAWRNDLMYMIENHEQAYEGQVFQWLHEGQNITILQFTGHYDKNREEIYEGDILEVIMDDEEIERYTTVVKPEGSGFCIEVVDQDYDITTLTWALDQSGIHSIEILSSNCEVTVTNRE